MRAGDLPALRVAVRMTALSFDERDHRRRTHPAPAVKSGSHLTHRWSGMDSNHWFREPGTMVLV